MVKIVETFQARNLMANKIVKAAVILFVLLFFILTGAYVYLRVKGKDLVVQRIQEQLGRKISFQSVGFSYPLTIKIQGLEVEGYGSARQTIFSVSLPHLFFGEIYFTHVELIDPCILMTRHGNEKISLIPATPSPEKAQGSSAATLPSQAKTPQLALFVRKMIVRNGFVEVFENKGNSASPLARIEKIDAEIEHLAFPLEKPVKTTLHVKAFVSGFDGRLTKEELKIIGWADFYQKDMAAQAKITGINGQVGLKADLKSVKNDMTVKGTMSLSFKAKATPEQGTKDWEGLFVQALQSSGANVDLNFEFKTKMDDFKASKISLSGEFKKNSLASP